MPQRARLSVYETERLTSRGMPVSVDIMDLTTLDSSGTEHHHYFPVISGGFGRGPAPGLDNALPSARGMTFPGATHVRAVYSLGEYRQHKGEPGVTVHTKDGKTDFYLRIGSPPDARAADGSLRGRSTAQIAAGNFLNSLAIHPDGDSVDIVPPLKGSRITYHDGNANDGTNGCFGVSAEYAHAFQALYESLPTDQKPQNLYVIDPPLRTPRATAAQYFPHLAK